MPALAGFTLAGIALGLWVPWFPTHALLPVVLLGVATLAWWHLHLRGLIFVTALALAGLDSRHYLQQVLPVELTSRNILVSGVVSDFPARSEDGQRFTLELSPAARQRAVPTRLQLGWYQVEQVVEAGECWTLLVRLKRPHGYRNRAGFDRLRWFFQRDIGAVGYVRDSVLNAPCRARADVNPAWRIRRAIAMRLDATLADEPALPLILGVSIGMRTRITPDQWSLLRQTGTSHLMAISGLHIGLIAAACWSLMTGVGRMLQNLGVRAVIPVHTLAGAVAAISATLYAGAAGFALPTLRALIMLLIALMLTRQQRFWQPTTAVAVAMLMTLLNDTRAVLGSGFWMSFGAVLLLLLCVPRVTVGATTSGQQLYWRLKQTLAAQWALGIGLAVPVLLFFDELPLLTPLANLIAIPLFALVVMPLIFTGCVLLWLWPAAATFLLVAGCRGLDGLLVILGWLAAWLPGGWSPGNMGWGAKALAVLGVALLLLPRPFPGRLLGSLTLTVVMFWRHQSAPPEFRLHVLDVGQGLAVLVQAGDRNLLFDTGPQWRAGNAGERIVVPELRSLGVERLDVLIVSHSDSDHIGGLSAVLDKTATDRLLLSRLLPEQQATLRVPGRSAAQLCRRGEEWRWGRTEFAILHPKNSAGWSDNNASCVLLIEHKGVRILLPGDIERLAEQVLAARSAWHGVDLVVAPHHGSKTSSGADFVRLAAAKFVVYSTGYANRWGFPHAEVMQRWEQAGACTLNTAHSGALEFGIAANNTLALIRAGRHGWTQPWAIRRESRCSIGSTPL